MFEDTSEVLFEQITDAPGEPDEIGMVIAALLSKEWPAGRLAGTRHPRTGPPLAAQPSATHRQRVQRSSVRPPGEPHCKTGLADR
jgi:hypothetical protein